jgi:HSP90 family molecular chaperone
VGLVRRGYEVILCDDPIDEYVFNTLREYEKKVSFFVISRILSTLVREISRCLMMINWKERNLSS